MVGAGPAALAAAVYTSREDIKTLICEKGVVGGLAAITAHIDNYPGFTQGVAGLELSEQLRGQAERFGAKIEPGAVDSIKPQADGTFAVETTNPEATHQAKTILIATGSEWQKLNIAGEDEFYGRGVHHCATCDGAFYRDRRLAVVGSGNSAAQESLFLTRYAKTIDILIRGPHWKASGALIKELSQNPKIRVHFNCPTEAIVGQVDPKTKTSKLTAIRFKRSGQTDEIAVDGVFVFVGLKPATACLAGTDVGLDQAGFVVTDTNFRTNATGIFAAGDVRSGATMQIASAVGEGASAALAIRHYLDDQKRS